MAPGKNGKGKSKANGRGPSRGKNGKGRRAW